MLLTSCVICGAKQSKAHQHLPFRDYYAAFIYAALSYSSFLGYTAFYGPFYGPSNVGPINKARALFIGPITLSNYGSINIYGSIIYRTN